MCTVCGCGAGETRAGEPPADAYRHPVEFGDQHHHDLRLPHGETLHERTQAPLRAHAAGSSRSRMVRIEQDILAMNDAYAAANRARFEHDGVLALDFVSSPGSGKTTLLARTITDLATRFRFVVVEGDQQTANDAERIRAPGADAIQINTGRGCHLDAHMVGHAVDSLAPAAGDVLFIENVGNLVCPAAFDLGEAHKVVILSVTEGEDKPLKYPDIFHAADLMLLSKTDLLPYVEFDVERCRAEARRVNPRLRVLALSARTGEGLGAWYDWLDATRRQRLAGHPLAPAG